MERDRTSIEARSGVIGGHVMLVLLTSFMGQSSHPDFAGCLSSALIDRFE